MVIQRNKLILAPVGFGLLIFTSAVLYSNSFLSSINAILTRILVKSESSAVQSLSTIRTLQALYASKHQGKFAPNFDELVKSMQLRDEFKGETSILDGYIYTMTVHKASGSQPEFYSITADPMPNVNSFSQDHRRFYFDSTLGSIKCTEENRPAKADDPSI